MVLLILCILCTSLFNCCHCLQVPEELSSLGGNTLVLLAFAAFGTISLIGACALCFRRKKTFEKLENEAGSPENIKKNEFPIFRALATEINESSAAIVPCERNNQSRDNLLNSSDNLTTDESVGGSESTRRNDEIDCSDVVLLEKPISTSQRDRSQQISRDTIIYETEKKHQSPSSKTPLLYAKNVQSYQQHQSINEQIQQKSVAAVFLSNDSTLNGFYNTEKDTVDDLGNEAIDKIDEFVVKNISNEELKISTLDSVSNPFFNSTVENCTIKENIKDDTSEIESSINDNSEKYQILEEETDAEDIKIIESIEDLPSSLYRQNSRGSNCSSNDKSVEEALRALDIAIGFEDDDGDDLEAVVIDIQSDEKRVDIEEIKEEAIFLVESIVNDCEKILENKHTAVVTQEKIEENDNDVDCFEDFLSLHNQNISTPCTKTKSNKKLPNNIDVTKVLFPGGIDLSAEINNDTFPISPNTFDITPNYNNNNNTFDVPTINDKTFDAPQLPSSSSTTDVPTIKIEKDKDEISSEDLSTVTPMNTPIELSYSSEAWDKISNSKGAISKQSNEAIINKTFDANDSGTPITFNHDGWYLHPQSKNDTFEICDDEDDGNMEDMSSTFDQLRRQLTEMLPHAQGMSAHNDFLDDDLNKDSSSPSENYGIKYGELDEATNVGSFDILGTILNPEPVTELNINYNNYKRPLSPIMEESECDETCRTFVLNNETKLLDSTSTGVLESASADAAVMGLMPKTLMASNDTLFNFDDTLSDPTDLLMSPRMHTAGSSSSSTLSRQESHDRISNERTPTNEELPKITAEMSTSKEFDAIDILKSNIRQHPLSLDLTSVEATANAKYELAKLALEEGAWPIELPEAQQIINDLSSPEQNRTADSLSFEQDITYTIDDQKTCVSFILKNDEERISEISEPFFASESVDGFADNADDASSLQIDDVISLDTDDNFNYEINDENGNQSIDTKESEIHLTEAPVFENDSINPACEKLSNYEIDSLEPETKILNDEMEADSIAASQISKSVYSNDSINETNNSVQNSDNSEHSNNVAAVANEQDSSDASVDDGSFKKKDNSPDIRQVSCNQSMMTTSFTKEWSDDDSSHSSEEFMYVKGEQVKSPSCEESKNDVEDEKEIEDENKSSESIEQTDIDNFTNNLRKSPIQRDESEDDESAEETEFIPSCWDQSLQPSKSSLKSPEKETSNEQPPEVKGRRRVAFKIQRYHSVYEYPSEVVQLSPAYSEPQLWSNYMDDYGGNFNYFAYSNQLADFGDALDGFNISSSSRPFHSSSFHTPQLHNTWPNENADQFSWSQFQDSNEQENYIKASENPFKIDWPIRRSIGEEDDSGVCESSESPSVSELNFSKNSLRLPLELVSSTSSEVSDFMSTDIVTKDLAAVTIDISNDESLQPKKINHDDDGVEDDDEIDNMHDSIFPTPSGSMDSLSSNSHSASSNSPSFTTFGKDKVLKDTDSIGKTSIIFIEDDSNLTHLDGNQKKVKNVEAIEGGKVRVVVGSSDDDSGFENVQIKCEAM